MTRSPLTVALTLAAGLFLASGCGKPSLDPAVVAEHRSRLEMAEEPDGAQTVLEVRKVMYGEDPAAEPDHANHDHDGDGVQDHAPEDHEHAAEDHDHAAGDVHDHAADAGDDVEETAPAAAKTDDHSDHEHADGEHADEEHADEEHADHDHAADHDHDGDGKQDHAAADHDDHADHDHEHAAHDGNHADAESKPVVEELDVVLVGSVGGVANPSDQSHPEFPFSKGQAVFFLADPEAVAEMEEHEHKHAPGEECAFCAAHAGDSAHMLAVVTFAGENGKPLPVDVRELFDLKEKDTVVVRGRAKMDPAGMLVVDATGLYVRR